MSDPADKLSAKQHKAIASLMSSTTIVEAAAMAGMDQRTIYRWLDEPAFVEAYRAARRLAVQHAIVQLQQASAVAVSTLVDLMAFGQPSIRLGAASKVLDLAIRGVEIEDLAMRLEALEKAHEQKLSR